MEPAERLARVEEATTVDGLYELGFTPEPDPPTSGQALLRVAVAEAGGGPVEGAQLTVIPWMPEHGHGVSQEPVVTELGGGEYEAGWSYVMPGYWELAVQVHGPAGTDEVLIAYEVL